jgi:hypothetical protein
MKKVRRWPATKADYINYEMEHGAFDMVRA